MKRALKLLLNIFAKIVFAILFPFAALGQFLNYLEEKKEKHNKIESTKD